MTQAQTPTDPNAGPAYETTDAKTRPLYASGLLLAGIIVGSFLIGSWMMGAFASEAESEGDTHPLATYRDRPEEAVLQARPKDEMDAYRVELEAVTTTYDWVDQPNGVVRVPVARAMELLLEEGLPTRPDGGR